MHELIPRPLELTSLSEEAEYPLIPLHPGAELEKEEEDLTTPNSHWSQQYRNQTKEPVMLTPYSRVYLHSLHAYGEVAKIHMDASAAPIYTIRLDDHALTPDGLYDARAVELVHLV